MAVLQTEHGVAGANGATVGGKNFRQGAADVFVLSSTTWGLQAQADGLGRRGEQRGRSASVAVSGDGSTAVAGAPGATVGAAYVFLRSGSTWTRAGC